MPAKVIFTSKIHPVRSFMGAKSNNYIPRVARKKLIKGIMVFDNVENVSK